MIEVQCARDGVFPVRACDSAECRSGTGFKGVRCKVFPHIGLGRFIKARRMNAEPPQEAGRADPALTLAPGNRGVPVLPPA